MISEAAHPTRPAELTLAPCAVLTAKANSFESAGAPSCLRVEKAAA